MGRLPRVAIVVAAVVLLTTIAAAGDAQPKLRVVATLPDLYVITKALVGDAAGVEVVARFGKNAHDATGRRPRSQRARGRRLDRRDRPWQQQSEDGPRHAHRHRGIDRDPGPEGPERAG